MRLSQTFHLRTEQTSPLLAEAFGLDTNFQINVLDVDVPDEWDILYITGESGCGKTTALHKYGSSTASIPPGPLWAWGDNEVTTLEVLSAVGLGDAVLFANYYEALSDSQKARAQIAARILQGQTLLIVDEFLSTLDRETAKAVAFCLQKTIRRLKLRMVCAEPHSDLEHYLQPKIVLRGTAWPSRWTYSWCVYANNPFTTAVHIAERDKQWYHNCRLAELHYRGKYSGGHQEYFEARIGDRTVGVLNAVVRGAGRGEDFVPERYTIARVVTHPSYRGCGIGVAMVKHFLKLHKDNTVDTVAAMARFNPIFSKAGMTQLDDTVVIPPEMVLGLIAHLGFDTSKWWSLSYCQEFTTSIDRNALAEAMAPHSSNLIIPGGVRCTLQERADKMKNEPDTCGRVLYALRPHEMARYTSGSAKYDCLRQPRAIAIDEM